MRCFCGRTARHVENMDIILSRQGLDVLDGVLRYKSVTNNITINNHISKLSKLKLLDYNVGNALRVLWAQIITYFNPNSS